MVNNQDFPSPTAVETTDRDLVVSLADGRRIATPLAWYPVLLAASADERAAVELSRFGVHWPDLDEDLSVRGMLEGRPAMGARPPFVAE